MKPFIIAEIGINHNGSLEIAKKLIDMAANCGCDAVKFQKRSIETIYKPDFLASPRESPWGTTQADQKKALEFSYKEYDAIDAYCQKRRIAWFASAWDIDSLDFLKKYHLPFNKIASPMLTHQEFCAAVAQEQKQTFIATGMSDLEQIRSVVELFKASECPFTLMHAVSIYPCLDDQCNLGMIPVLKALFDCVVGYSSHSRSWEDCVLAVSLGAVAIEKHITLDRAMYGSDQAASLEEGGLKRLVRECQKVEGYLGDGIKRILPEEERNARKLRYWLEAA